MDGRCGPLSRATEFPRASHRQLLASMHILDANRVLPRGFYLIHQRVGSAEQLLAVIRGTFETDRSNAGRHGPTTAGHLLANALLKSLEQRLDRVGICLGKQESEFVSAQSSNAVCGSTSRTKDFCEPDQHGVTFLMSLAVVDLFEVIEVHVGESYRVPIAARSFCLDREQVEERTAVGQPCERVDTRGGAFLVDKATLRDKSSAHESSDSH